MWQSELLKWKLLKWKSKAVSVLISSILDEEIEQKITEEIMKK